MKDETKFDKYGFRYHSTSARRTSKNLIIEAKYFDDKENPTYLNITLTNRNRSFDDGIIRNVKSNLEDKNILDAFIYLLHIQYNYADLQLIERIDNLINCLPDSILMNNIAVKEILSRLPKKDSLLIVVANQIKAIREEIRLVSLLEDKSAIANEVAKINEEFGL